MNNPSTKIVIVDDHGILRQGLRALFAAERNFHLVGEALDGRHALDVVRKLRPDVVIMDVRLPGLNGIETTRQLLAAHRQIKVIGLSADADDRTALSMFRAGAVGFIKKDAAYEELLTAIHIALEGGIFFAPAVIAAAAQGGDSEGPLSPREREHLQLIADGKTTKEIATLLEVSVKTAETHRRNLMMKLQVDSIAGLTKYAVRKGFTNP